MFAKKRKEALDAAVRVLLSKVQSIFDKRLAQTRKDYEAKLKGLQTQINNIRKEVLASPESQERSYEDLLFGNPFSFLSVSTPRLEPIKYSLKEQIEHIREHLGLEYVTTPKTTKLQPIAKPVVRKAKKTTIKMKVKQ